MPESASNKKTREGFDYESLLLPACCLILTLFVWDTTWFFPVKLLTILTHEVTHGLVALLTGGSISEIKVTMEAGGSCAIEGGNKFWIASAGYPGSLIAGVLLYIAAFRTIFRRYLNISLSVLFFVFMSMYIKDAFGIFSVLGIITGFLALPEFLPEKFAPYFTRVSGALVLAYSIVDIKNDLFGASSAEINDIQQLCSVSIMHPYICSVLYFLFAILALFFAVKFGGKNPKMTQKSDL